MTIDRLAVELVGLDGYSIKMSLCSILLMNESLLQTYALGSMVGINVSG